jgi:hypothetical protein
VENLDYENAKMGYKSALDLLSLVSREIYSRFSAMLVVQGILMKILFDTFSGKDYLLVICISVIGLILCFIWIIWVYHGIYYQDRFRKIASFLEEKYFKDTFKIFHSISYPEKDITDFAPIEAKGIKKLAANIKYEISAFIIISVFVIIYIVSFWSSLIKYI